MKDKITNLLDSTIQEVLNTDKFTISQFKIGTIIYDILQKEIEEDIIQITGIDVTTNSIRSYRGIPIVRLDTQYTILYELKLK